MTADVILASQQILIQNGQTQMNTVIILGASENRSKFGNKSLRAHLRAGWIVIPVNPKGGEIEGQAVVTSLADVPQPIDRVSVYLPPRVVIDMLPEIAHLDCGELWLNPGSYDDDVLRVAQELGIKSVTSCSIVDVGFSPSDFPDE